MELCVRRVFVLLLAVLAGAPRAHTHTHTAGGQSSEDRQLVTDRHAVYWNSSNPRFSRSGELTVEVSINDYLDVLCPHYWSQQRNMEQYVLYMVSYDGYSHCDRHKGFKRWDCNRPTSANGPIRFSEKFQLFTPFSLGFEFRPGHEYYYISSPHPNLGSRPCLKLKIYVKPTNDSLYESPEPFLTDDTTGGCDVIAKPRPLFIMTAAAILFYLTMMMFMSSS